MSTVDQLTVDFVTPVCPFCGIASIVQMTAEQAVALELRELVQDVLPHLSLDTREQIISGTHPTCWTENFGPDEDEETDEYAVPVDPMDLLQCDSCQ